MRILAVSPYIPWPLHGGASIRIYNLLKHLSAKGHRITLLAGSNGTSIEAETALRSCCEEIHTFATRKAGTAKSAVLSLFSLYPYPYYKWLTRSLRESMMQLLREREFDLALVNFLVLASGLPLDQMKRIPIVVDEHESQSLVWKGFLQSGTLPERLFAVSNLLKLRRLENRVLVAAHAVVCVSQEEANLLRKPGLQADKIVLAPNGVDEKFFQTLHPPWQGGSVILLCGSMGIKRNVDAACWFAREVFPLVRQAIPDSEFWVVGSNPTKEVTNLEQIEGVHVTGTVDDVRKYHDRARVVVAPFKFGAGTKLKVLEALAMTRPLVATSNGCQGIEMQPGRHFLLADTPHDFSECVVDLIRDTEKAEILARAGRALVEEKYSWSQIVDALEERLQAIALGHNGSASG